MFSRGDIISRKATKAQLRYFSQTDYRIYKGRIIIPLLGADDAKIKKTKDGLYQVARDYSGEKDDREIVFRNGARIDEGIVQAFQDLGPDEYLFVGTERNAFRTRFRSLEDLSKYVSAFHIEYNKNEKEMGELFQHVHVVSFNRDKIGQTNGAQKSQGSRRRR